MTYPSVVSVIDDDPEVRSATRSILRSYDLETRVYESAEDFLASGDLDRTDCLLTDVQMGGMSGLELLGYLKDRSAPFPVIVMTSFDTDRVAAQAMSRGACAFLPKPLDIDALMRALESCG